MNCAPVTMCFHQVALDAKLANNAHATPVSLVDRFAEQHAGLMHEVRISASRAIIFGTIGLCSPVIFFCCSCLFFDFNIVAVARPSPACAGIRLGTGRHDWLGLVGFGRPRGSPRGARFDDRAARSGRGTARAATLMICYSVRELRQFGFNENKWFASCEQYSLGRVVLAPSCGGV